MLALAASATSFIVEAANPFSITTFSAASTICSHLATLALCLPNIESMA